MEIYSSDEEERIAVKGKAAGGTTMAASTKKRKILESESEESEFGRETNSIREAVNRIQRIMNDICLAKDIKKELIREYKAIKYSVSKIDKLFSNREGGGNNKEVENIKNILMRQEKVLQEQSKKIEEIKQIKSVITCAGALGAVGGSGCGGRVPGEAVSSIKVAGLKKPITTGSSFKVALTASRGNISGEQLLKDIKKNLKPISIGFRPNKIYANRENKVIIEAKDNCYDKLKNLEMLTRAQITVAMMGKMNPRLAIYNVPIDTDREKLAAEIIEQNNLDADISEGKEPLVKPVYKFGPKDKHFVHWVVEVDPRTRKRLLSKKTLYIGWHSCNVEDKIYLTKCYNCQGYGHTAQKCNQKSACGFCAGEHDSRQCQYKDNQEAQKCILCVRAGIEDNKHKPRDGKCGAYKKRMEVFVVNIDFGDDEQN